MCLSPKGQKVTYDTELQEALPENVRHIQIFVYINKEEHTASLIYLNPN